jgi:hypothetical protein
MISLWRVLPRRFPLPSEGEDQVRGTTLFLKFERVEVGVTNQQHLE